MRRISACILVVRKNLTHEPEVLMQFKRRYNEWEFPGGKLDGKETARECAFRELNEETTLISQDLWQLQYMDHGSKFGCVIFATTHWTGVATITEPDKQTTMGWFKLDELPAPLTKYSAMVIETGCLALAAEKLATTQEGRV